MRAKELNEDFVPNEGAPDGKRIASALEAIAKAQSAQVQKLDLIRSHLQEILVTLKQLPRR